LACKSIQFSGLTLGDWGIAMKPVLQRLAMLAFSSYSVSMTDTDFRATDEWANQIDVTSN